MHGQQLPPEFEVIYRDWSDTYSSNDTVVFLVTFQKKGLDRRAIQHFRDGFRVFSLRKPYGQPFNAFKQSLTVVTLWKRILEIIKAENTPFIYTISDAKKASLTKSAS